MLKLLIKRCARRYLLADERGSIIAEMTSTGSLLQAHQYDAYGNPKHSSSARFRYTGQILIPGTELYYYKARIYHPKLGRFMQTDPIGYQDGMNWYAYVGNDPLNEADPSGTESRSVLLQDLNDRDYLDGKITKDEFMKNRRGLAGGEITLQAVKHLTPLGLYIDVSESLSRGDAPISEAFGVVGGEAAGVITSGIQYDLGSSGSLKARVIKFIIEGISSTAVQTGTERIDELANNEFEQKE